MDGLEERDDLGSIRLTGDLDKPHLWKRRYYQAMTRTATHQHPATTLAAPTGRARMTGVVIGLEQLVKRL